jgi:hypothetical protein
VRQALPRGAARPAAVRADRRPGRARRPAQGEITCLAVAAGGPAGPWRRGSAGRRRRGLAVAEERLLASDLLARMAAGTADRADPRLTLTRQVLASAGKALAGQLGRPRAQRASPAASWAAAGVAAEAAGLVAPTAAAQVRPTAAGLVAAGAAAVVAVVARAVPGELAQPDLRVPGARRATGHMAHPGQLRRAEREERTADGAREEAASADGGPEVRALRARPADHGKSLVRPGMAHPPPAEARRRGGQGTGGTG